MNELALFAGIGGGILGGQLLGWRTVCAVEIEGYARDVLLARQNDGNLEPFPIWDDVCTFDGQPWRGIADVVSGGFPCQDVSIARAMWGRDGIKGKQSGLWREMFRIIEQVQPSYVFGENSPELKNNGLREIIEQLAGIGYVSRWCVIGAESCGLNHKRHRLWFAAANTNAAGFQGHVWNESNAEGRENADGSIADAFIRICEKCGYQFEDVCGKYGCPNCESHGIGQHRNQGTGLFPTITGMDYGIANRVDRIKAVGNAQIPSVAAIAWKILVDNGNA